MISLPSFIGRAIVGVATALVVNKINQKPEVPRPVGFMHVASPEGFITVPVYDVRDAVKK
jgi:hypothetical protein